MITIIGILIALLLPAVQAAREAARRVGCGSNVRQLSIGLHSYHEAKRCFPPGYLSGGPANFNLAHWTWSAFILPFIEQRAMYDALQVSRYDFGLVDHYVPSARTQTVLPIYVCPSDIGPKLNHMKQNYAKSNYRGVMGTKTGTLMATYDNLSPAMHDGVIFMDSCLPINQISDGTSNTILIGECKLDLQGGVHRAAIWPGERGMFGADENGMPISDTMWWLRSTPEWRVNGSGSQAFCSNHPGGAHFGFADGSCHFLYNTINDNVLDCLSARNDGQVIGGF